jgi:hypothetical protein
LNIVGRGRPAALALEAVLERQWDERLLDEYARCEVPGSRATIERAENWLKEHPRSQPLLRALARICLRQQLWGKARAYLEECQRLGADPRTSLALAELAEAVGDPEAAGRHFREAALGLARRDPEEALRGPRVRREATVRSLDRLFLSTEGFCLQAIDGVGDGRQNCKYPPGRFGDRARSRLRAASALWEGALLMTYVYVDGFNLYYGVLRRGPHRWLDLERLCSTRNIAESLNPSRALPGAHSGHAAGSSTRTTSTIRKGRQD